MWVGGYSDWMFAEQREWDRDMAELEGEREERELFAKNEDKLHWLELALDDPMFKVSYTRVFGSNLSVVDITQHPPSKEGARKFDFKVVYPLYQGLNDDFFWTRKTSKTSQIKIKVSSQKHWDVIYICEFSPDQWSAKMDEIIEALTDQLTMKQDLNRGLLMSLSFHEE